MVCICPADREGKTTKKGSNCKGQRKGASPPLRGGHRIIFYHGERSVGEKKPRDPPWKDLIGWRMGDDTEEKQKSSREAPGGKECRKRRTKKTVCNSQGVKKEKEGRQKKTEKGGGLDL